MTGGKFKDKDNANIGQLKNPQNSKTRLDEPPQKATKKQSNLGFSLFQKWNGWMVLDVVIDQPDELFDIIGFHEVIRGP